MTRAGKRAFNRCNVKVVEFHEFVFPSSVSASEITRGAGVVTAGDKTGQRILVTPQNVNDVSSNWAAGCEAVLRCPVTEDQDEPLTSQTNNHVTKLASLESLRSIAGELLCRNCRFSSMTPVEVSLERQEIAEAETARIEAFTHLQAAQIELAKIVSPHLLDKPH